jgi:hypothetical protein
MGPDKKKEEENEENTEETEDQEGGGCPPGQVKNVNTGKCEPATKPAEKKDSTDDFASYKTNLKKLIDAGWEMESLPDCPKKLAVLAEHIDAAPKQKVASGPKPAPGIKKHEDSESEEEDDDESSEDQVLAYKDSEDDDYPLPMMNYNVHGNSEKFADHFKFGSKPSGG